MKFKTTLFTWVLDEKTHIRVRNYVTVTTGLSWTEAKLMRMSNHKLMITREYPVFIGE